MKGTLTLLLAIVTGPAILLLWSLLHAWSCAALLLPAFIALILTLSAREYWCRHRRCVADCYFERGSLLHRLVGSTTLVTLASLLISIGLTTLLLASIPGWGLDVLVLLTLDAVLLTLLYFALFHAAGGLLRVNTAFRYLFAKRWAILLNLPLVVTALLFLQLQQPPPAWLNAGIKPGIDASLNLETTLRNASQSVGSRCPIIDRVVRLNQEKEALSWWIALQGSRHIDDSRLRWVAWLLFLLSGTLSLWAYSRLCVQLVCMAHRRGWQP